MTKTLGISPKVAVPAALQFVAGIVFLVTGDTDTGKTLVLSSLGSFGVGFAAPNSPTLTVGSHDPDA